MVKRRQFSVFSLSFLDVMSCGFGAVILIFLIINHNRDDDRQVNDDVLLAEIRMLDYQVQQGEKDRFKLLDALDDVKARVEESDENLASTQSSIENKEANLEDLEDVTVAREESLKALNADIESREKEVNRLLALKAANDGAQVRSFEGDGDRQYLTGLKVGGKNIIIAIDTSASMLDDTIVNILRRRNMSDKQKRAAPKWQRAVRTVEWLAAQLPLDAEFQLFTYAEDAASAVPDSKEDWVPMHDGQALSKSVTALRQTIPVGGSSLVNLILKIRKLSPIPDNVYLITDGLPTMGEKPPRSATVSGKRRLDLFAEAVNRLPKQIPVNVIMFPMEGDPMASAAYWNVARVTGGAFISPSWDWP